MRESRSLQKKFFSRFQKNIITFFFSVLENFVTSFFLSFFVSSLKFVGEEMGFTYEIIIKFFCQFRLSCNIYRRNNTTISRDMRERERTRSKFRKFKKFRSYLQNKIKIKKDKNKEIDRERERKKEKIEFVFLLLLLLSRTNENADVMVEIMNINGGRSV